MIFLIFLNIICFGVNPATIGGNSIANSNYIGDKSPESVVSTPNTSDAQSVSTWWDERFEYRQQLLISEPGLAQRVEEPVHAYLTFLDETHHINSTRVAKFEGGTTWSEIPCQVWNESSITLNYITAATISFKASILQGVTSSDYFVYYSSKDTGNVSYTSNLKTETIWKESPYDDEVNSLRVENGQFNLTINTTQGISGLEASGRNYHTSNSLAPSPGLISSNGLVGYWTFDEGSSSNLYDTSGNDNHGTISGATYSTDAKIGTSLEFDGTDSVTIPDSPELRLGKQQTIAAWLKPTVNVGDWVRVIGKGAYTARNYGLWRQNDGDPLYQVLNGTGTWGNCWVDGNTSMSLSIGAWVYVVGTWDGTTMRLYLNGTFRCSLVFTSEPDQTSDPLTFGYAGFHTYFKGLLDEVRIYNRALSASEVVDLYNYTGQSTVKTIEVLEAGPVFTKIGLEWVTIGNLTTWDTLMIYNDFNRYSIDRKYYWAVHKQAGNNSWEALNTRYSNTWVHSDFGSYSRYFYDNATYEPAITASTPFTANNYTVFRGPESATPYTRTSLGIFLTGFSRGDSDLTYSWLEWKSTNVGSQFQFIPGNRTDLNNVAQPVPYPTTTLTLTFWEYLRVGDAFVNDFAGVSTDFFTTFQCLKTPLTTVVAGERESRFFNLGIEVVDIDGNAVSSANVSLYNLTELGALDQYVTSTLTSSSGIANLTRLVANNYTMNVTYGAEAFTSYVYGTSLDLASETFTLNQTTVDYQTSKFFKFTANMTSTTLNFISLQTGEDPAAPIGGARITFFEVPPTGPSSEIGNLMTDESGALTFHWRNFTEEGPGVETNITFDCWYYNDFRPINLTMDVLGTLNASIWFRNATTPTHTVTVNIGTFSSTLQVLTGTIDETHVYGDLLSFAVNYTYTFGPTTDAITGANIRYQLSSTARGVFNSSSFTETSSGIYNFSFWSNDSSLNLRANVPYVMTIQASCAGFAPASQFVSITLQVIDTTITPAQSKYILNWNDEFTVSVNYTESLNSELIPGAQLSYQVKRGGTSVVTTGNLIEVSGGVYNITLNSTILTYIGSYTIVVTGSKTNYKTTTFEIALQVDPILTYVASWFNMTEQSTFIVKVITHNVTVDLPMYFNYTTAAGIGIAGAATASYNWDASDHTSGSGQLLDMGNGNYSLDFNVATRKTGEYTLSVNLQQTNYIQRPITISLVIVAKPMFIATVSDGSGNVILEAGTVLGNQGENVSINVDLIDPVNQSLPLLDALVEISLDGGQTWLAFTPDPSIDGRYTVSVSAAASSNIFAPINTRVLIQVTKTNYTMYSGEFSFNIGAKPPEFANIPIIYWIIMILTVGVMVGIFATAKGVQRARIPRIIKDISAARDLIRKRRVVEDTLMVSTKTEMLHKALASDWSAIGLTLPAPERPKAVEPRPEPEELQKKEASA